MASSVSRYSVGNKVYRGGSSAPTMGTVDPTGYVEREMASQRRSGLAAAALRRVQSPSVAFGQTTNRTPTPGTKPYDNPIAQSAQPISAGTGAFGGNVPRSIPQVQSSPTGKIIQAPAPQPQPQMQTPDAQGYSYTSPVAPYNEPSSGLSDGWYNLRQTDKRTGQPIPGAKTHRELLDEGLAASAALHSARAGAISQGRDPASIDANSFRVGGGVPGMAAMAGGMGAPGQAPGGGMASPTATAPVGIPMPYEQSMEQVAQLKQLQDALNGYTEQEQNVNRDYTTGTRDVELQRPEVMRSLLNNFSGRGLAFSSGYGDQVGERNNEFSRMLSDLANQKNDALTGIIRGRASANEGYNGAMAAIQAAATRALESQAGNLNLAGTPASAGAEANPFEPDGDGVQEMEAPEMGVPDQPQPFFPGVEGTPQSTPFGNGTNPTFAGGGTLNVAPQAPAQALARPNAAQIGYEQSLYGPQASAADVQVGTANDTNTLTSLLWALYGNKPTAGSKPWDGR